MADGARARCTQGWRHWFTYYGHVGSSSPTCVRCGGPNPNYDAGRDTKRRRIVP